MVPGKNDNEYITSLEPAFFSKEKATPAKVLTTKGDGLQTSLEKKSEREKLPFKKFSIINPVPDKEIPESLRSWLESETGESITVDDIIEISSKYKYNLNTIPMGRLGSSKPDFSLIADPASIVFKDMSTFERKSAARMVCTIGWASSFSSMASVDAFPNSAASGASCKYFTPLIYALKIFLFNT